MTEVPFTFRPMANFDAPLREGAIYRNGPFVVIDAITGHPLYLNPTTALAVANAIREAYGEARKITVLK